MYILKIGYESRVCKAGRYLHLLALLACTRSASTDAVAMPPKNKAKAAVISASSFFDLKAELTKHEEDFAKNKAAGKSSATVRGVKRPDKVCHSQMALQLLAEYPIINSFKLSEIDNMGTSE